ncbi:hypothetical protein LEMLEM_LOCUS20171 [Lemmus lemmus]
MEELLLAWSVEISLFTVENVILFICLLLFGERIQSYLPRASWTMEKNSSVKNHMPRPDSSSRQRGSHREVKVVGNPDGRGGS